MTLFSRTTGLLIALCSSTAWCVEIEQVSVLRSGKIFSTEAVFLVEAPQGAVVDAITAFDRLSDLNPAVVSSSVEVRVTDEIRVTTQIRACVSFFCRSMALVEDVRFDQAGNLRSQIVPKLSDFASGDATWQFDTVGEKTRVRYQSRMQPKFWLPPFLGSAVFRHALERQIRVAANSIETLAIPDRLSDSHPPARTGRDSDQ